MRISSLSLLDGRINAYDKVCVSLVRLGKLKQPIDRSIGDLVVIALAMQFDKGWVHFDRVTTSE